jgi:DNA-binding NarL/FixJ family response regulator
VRTRLGSVPLFWREIAEPLHIRKKTLERHRANVLEKLGMRDRVELTRYAIRRGLVKL